MPTVSTPAALPSHIEELLSTREMHVEAVAKIDATLVRVSAALGVADVTHATAPASAKRVVAKAPVAKTVAAPAPKKRGAVSKFGMSANDFVLSFLGSMKGGATTQEINKHWIASGRPRNADNSLSILTKAKKLKRVKLPKVPGKPSGSRFTVA